VFARIKAYLIRRRFERLFAAELHRVETQQFKHLKVKPSQAALQDRVHAALARRASA